MLTDEEIARRKQRLEGTLYCEAEMTRLQRQALELVEALQTARQDLREALNGIDDYWSETNDNFEHRMRDKYGWRQP